MALRAGGACACGESACVPWRSDPDHLQVYMDASCCDEDAASGSLHETVSRFVGIG